MVRGLALAGALLIAVTAASAFPYMDGNGPQKIHKGIVFDSLLVPNGRSRGVYLIDVAAGSVRSNMDSTLNLWFNGGATPRFRRIQHFICWANNIGNTLARAVFDITIYRDGATSQNHLEMDVYGYVPDIPLEADSIRITSRTGVGTNLELSYVIW